VLSPGRQAATRSRGIIVGDNLVVSERQCETTTTKKHFCAFSTVAPDAAFSRPFVAGESGHEYQALVSRVGCGVDFLALLLDGHYGGGFLEQPMPSPKITPSCLPNPA